MSEEQTLHQLRGDFTPRHDPTAATALRNVSRTVVGSRKWSKQPVIDNNDWATLGSLPATEEQCRDWLNLLEAQYQRLVMEYATGAPPGYNGARWNASRQVQIRNIKQRRHELHLWAKGQAQVIRADGRMETVQVRSTAEARSKQDRYDAVAALLGGEVTDQALLFALYDVTQRVLRMIKPEDTDISYDVLSPDDRQVLRYVRKMIKLHVRGESV